MCQMASLQHSASEGQLAVKVVQGDSEDAETTGLITGAPALPSRCEALCLLSSGTRSSCFVWLISMHQAFHACITIPLKAL